MQLRYVFSTSVIFAFLLNIFLLGTITLAQSVTPVPTQRPSFSNTQPMETKKLNPIAGGQTDTAAFDACLKELSKRGVQFLRQEPFETEDGCKIADPVKIMSVAGLNNAISLSAQPQLSCQFALKLSTWLSDVSAPLTEHLTRVPLTSIATGPGYVCRHRNNDATRKISEHAFGNAIDITSFRFANGENLAVSAISDGSFLEKRMLSALRTTACGYFTTVLGPGSNEAHSSHFHLDHGKHGRTWNYRICE